MDHATLLTLSSSGCCTRHVLEIFIFAWIVLTGYIEKKKLFHNGYIHELLECCCWWWCVMPFFFHFVHVGNDLLSSSSSERFGVSRSPYCFSCCNVVNFFHCFHVIHWFKSACVVFLTLTLSGAEQCDVLGIAKPFYVFSKHENHNTDVCST